jgi:hypothetical protein
MRRLLLTAVGVGAITVAVLVGAAVPMPTAGRALHQPWPRSQERPRPDMQTERRFKEVPVRSPDAVGIDGHQWNVECAPGARLPCRAMCECGWTSTAGQRTQVLLELKGHLEETLKDGAGLSRTRRDLTIATSRQGGNHADL